MDQQTSGATPQPAVQGGSKKPRAPDDCVIVLFGANGDLTHRLVFPALYNLGRTGLLPRHFALLGVDLADQDAEAWRNGLSDGLRKLISKPGSEFSARTVDEAALGWLADRMDYLRGDMTQPACYEAIAGKLSDLAHRFNTGGNAMFYLAVADRFFGPVVDHLGASGLTHQSDGQWRRVVIEKPFGHDLASAKALNAQVLKTLGEDQVFRMDHFLGKETVQNIMALRFANGLFEPIWNRDRIEHVQITVAETVGVEQRGKFYEATGALRDMVPNHVFQLLAMVAMEPPVSFDADAVRSRKTDVLSAVRALTPDDAVRGQYGAGESGGEPARAYREEPNVASNSPTETYVALRLQIDNWRWAGVPFFLRTGKHLTKRWTEIAIRFRQAPTALFADTDMDRLPPNWLVLRIQPDEGIDLQFEVKRPGPQVELAPVLMDFKYKDWFPSEANVGYETLLYDVMIGDATLFQRADQVEAGWHVVQPVLDHWTATPPTEFPNYASGSAGPAAADALIAEHAGRHGRAWRPLRT